MHTQYTTCVLLEDLTLKGYSQSEQGKRNGGKGSIMWIRATQRIGKKMGVGEKTG